MKSRDNLIKQTNIMMIAAIVGGLCNFLYQILMNRSLDPADFADFYALLGIFVILSVPSMTIQATIAKLISRLRAQDNYAGITRIFFGSLKRVAFLGIIFFSFFILVSGYLARFLSISSRLPVIITGLALFSAFLIPISYGALQGLQKFTSLGLNIIIATVLRVASGVFFVSLGFRASGAIGGSIIFAAFAFGLALRDLKPHFQKHSPSKEKQFLEMYKYSLPVLTAFFLLTLLSFADILLVKHFFEEGAASYATASVLARAIIYLPMTISMVLFPKAAEAEARQENPVYILKKSLLYSLLLSLGASFTFLIFPEFFIRIFRQEYLDSAPALLKGFGFALIPFGLITIMVYYNLAIHRMKFIYGLGAGTILHFSLLWFFHATLLQVILILGVSGISILGIVSFFTIDKRNKIQYIPSISPGSR